MSLSFLENNCNLLREHRPLLWESVQPLLDLPIPGEVTYASNGLPSMRWPDPDGQMIDLHPSHDPQAGCQQCVDQLQGKSGQIIFVLGFGLGYEVMAVCEQYGLLNQIKIIDSDPLFFVQAMKHCDLTSLIVNKNVFLYIDTAIADLHKIILHADRWYLLKDPAHLLVLKEVARVSPEFYQAVPQRLLRLVTAQAQQSHTTVRQAKAMLSN